MTSLTRGADQQKQALPLLLEDAYPGIFSGKMGMGSGQNVGIVLLTPISK
jgi:hypothetical protein